MEQEPKKYNCICGESFEIIKDFRSHLLVKGRDEPGKHKSIKGRPVEVIESKEPEIITTGPSQIVIRKKSTKQLFMLGLGGFGIFLGVASFIFYVFTTNMIIGVPGVLLGVGGFVLLYIYRSSGGDVFVEHLEGAQIKNANALHIYRDTIRFEAKPQKELLGYPWRSRNDKQPYALLISGVSKDDESPRAFMLPDQQFISPEYFAERPLSLPAHRKLFSRREKMTEYIKTGFLILAIIIVWILIVTTT